MAVYSLLMKYLAAHVFSQLLLKCSVSSNAILRLHYYEFARKCNRYLHFVLRVNLSWKRVHTKRRTHKIIIIIKTDYGWAISRIRSIQRENYYWRVPENIKLIQCTWNTHNIQRIEATPMNVKIYIRYAFDNRYVWCGMRTTNQAIQEPKLHNAQLLIVCCNFHFIFIPCNFYRFFFIPRKIYFFHICIFCAINKNIVVSKVLAGSVWVSLGSEETHTHGKMGKKKETDTKQKESIHRSSYSWSDHELMIVSLILFAQISIRLEMAWEQVFSVMRIFFLFECGECCCCRSRCRTCANVSLAKQQPNNERVKKYNVYVFSAFLTRINNKWSHIHIKLMRDFSLNRRCGWLFVPI